MKTKKLITLLLSLCLAVTTFAMFGCANNQLTSPNEGMQELWEQEAEGGTSKFKDYYKVERVSDYALFKADGTINGTVVEALNTHLNTVSYKTKAKWSEEEGATYDKNAVYQPYMESTAADFSAHVLKDRNPDTEPDLYAGGLVIKLFDEHENMSDDAKKMASRWWQVVYRSGSLDESGNLIKEEDYLTFYMVEPYKDGKFQEIDGDDVAFTKAKAVGGNYSTSLAKDTIHTDLNNVLSALDTNNVIRNTIATPSHMPSGWQSSAFQTGTGEDPHYKGLGTSKYHATTTNMSLNNGLDGEGQPHLDWKYYDKDGEQKQVLKLESNYDDLITLPSGFEIFYMGDDKDLKRATESIETTTGAAIGSGRHGLWQLGGYDRAYNQFSNGKGQVNTSGLAWLRSGYSSEATRARIVNTLGHLNGVYVSGSVGLRPSIHLNLSQLAEQASVSAAFSGGDGEVAVSATDISEGPSSTPIDFQQNKHDEKVATLTFTAPIDKNVSAIFIGETKLEIGSSFKTTPLCEYEATTTDGGKTVTLKIRRIRADITIRAALNTPLANVKIGAVATEYFTIESAFSHANSAVGSASITLLGSVYSSTTLVVNAGKTITLELGEYTINRGLSASNPSISGSVITVHGKLILKGTGTITGGNAYHGGGILVGYGGNLDMQGGTISGNNATSGGGVALLFGTFTMSGNAKITDNTATNDGGGVSVFQSTFNMSGDAKITANEAQSGGGVHVYSYSTFKHGDDMVTGNTASKNSDVYNNGGIQGLRG